MNRKETSAIVPLLFLTLLVTGCGRNPSAPIVQAPPEIIVAPNEIVVGGTTLRLQTYLWRNFQPGSSPDTRLLAQLRIQAGTGNPIPPGLVVEKAWLVLDDEAWVSTPQQEAPPSSASNMEYMSRGGPEWAVGALITATVQVRDASNNSYLLRAAPQAIGRVE
ncbi:MAG TPA: hypothetical protein VK478_07980 [Gemmatimonadaceae bacterium]|jgi:hypothetical protein|nr:hypothetical protein [Gemmatimonadaceae bacterium]